MKTLLFCLLLLGLCNNLHAQSDYFPVEIGASWKYAFGAELYAGTPYEHYSTYVEILDASETIDGKDYFVSKTSMGSGDSDMTVIQTYFRYGKDGALIAKAGKDKPEIISMNQTPKVGDTHASQQGGTSKVIDLNASIKTPTKTYTNCLLLEIRENNTVSRAYYEKNKGMVATTIMAEGSEKIFMYLVSE